MSIKDPADLCLAATRLFGREKGGRIVRDWLYRITDPDYVSPREMELRNRYSDDYMREVQKAMMLATDLEACKALLRGETVPRERIDWEQAKRYGRTR